MITIKNRHIVQLEKALEKAEAKIKELKARLTRTF
jgi:hypothetical protein